MPQGTFGQTKDISVLQLLTKLVQETDRVIRLADDIDQYASTPQAKAAINLIGSEVNNILHILKVSLDPLYRLYELDPGMQTAQKLHQSSAFKDESELVNQADHYDENALWAEIKSKSLPAKPPESD